MKLGVDLETKMCATTARRKSKKMLCVSRFSNVLIVAYQSPPANGQCVVLFTAKDSEKRFAVW